MKKYAVYKVALTGMALICLFSLIAVGMLWKICSNNELNDEAWNVYVSSQPAIASNPADSARQLYRFEDTSVVFKTPLGESRSPFGYMDSSGQIAVPASFSSCASSFSEGLAWAFATDGQGMYINSDGALVFEIDAVGLSDFSSGLARIRTGNNNSRTMDGFVNRGGQVVIDFKYRHARDFVGGYALVSESHFATGLLESIVDLSGMRLNVCFAYRKKIIDVNGSVVHPSRLSGSK